MVASQPATIRLFGSTYGGDDVGLAVGEAAEKGNVQRGAVGLRDLSALVAQHWALDMEGRWV